MRKLFCLTAIFLFTAAGRFVAAGAGDEVVVIYNTRVPESKAVADYYARRRNVPEEQIIGLALPTTEHMSRAEFRDSLQIPLNKALVNKKLWRFGSETIPATNGQPKRVLQKVVESKIRYAVLCYGVPSRIQKDAGLKEKIDDSVIPELRRNEAAVDTELALLPCLEQNLPLSGPLPNPFYALTNGTIMHPTNGLLLVTRLDGPTPQLARGLVDKALEAETNGLWGRAYFDTRGTTNPGYKQGDDWIRGAHDICRRLGFESVLDEKPGPFQPEFPMSHIAIYCGWYDEHASGPFAEKEVEFMPGAFAYHLHSFSAATLRSTTNRWVGPLIQKGATATMGCVDEPYLSGTPDVAVFCSRFLFSGFNFAESAYASQNVLSWQITIVGDPLYRPFGKPAPQLHEELAQKQSKLLEWSFLRLMNLNLQQGKRPLEISTFLEQLPLTRKSAVLTEKLADLYAAQGKPASTVDAYEKALKLEPSRLQRVRLHLALVERFAAMGEDRKTYDTYRRLLNEVPDYPDKFGILRKILDLAIHKLKDKDEITRSVQDMSRFGEEQNRKIEQENKKEN